MAINPSKIVIDARFYGTTHTGPGRYVENLIKNLTGKVTLIVNSSDYDRPELAKFPRVISHTHPYSLLSQFEIPYLLFKLKPNLVHFPISSTSILWPGKYVVTFHDLIKHVFKGPATTTRNHVFYWFKYYAYLIIDYVSAKRAAAIIVPTKYWQEIIQKKYRVSKIYVTHEAVDENFLLQKPSPIKGLKKPFLVHTGNLYPHKNLAVLFESMKQLNFNLYLICARSVFAARAEKQIREMSLQNKVFFLGKLADSEIKFVYSQAEALVFPSKVEGFGLNGLEAMASGCPVVSSNATCLPEVYGPAALYFDPNSPKDLISQIQKLPKFRKKLIDLGKQQIKKYSWVKMGNQTWKIYQSV